MALDTKLSWYGDDKKKDMDSGMIKALTRSINLVQSTAKTLSPVDTGNLRGSIVKAVQENLLTATAATNAEYAPYVEFGLRNTPNYPKQPFMRPSLFNNKKNIKKIFIDEGEKSVNK